MAFSQNTTYLNLGDFQLVQAKILQISKIFYKTLKFMIKSLLNNHNTNYDKNENYETNSNYGFLKNIIKFTVKFLENLIKNQSQFSEIHDKKTYENFVESVLDFSQETLEFFAKDSEIVEFTRANIYEFCLNLCIYGKNLILECYELTPPNIFGFICKLCDTNYESCAIVIIFCSKLLEKTLGLDLNIHVNNLERSLCENSYQIHQTFLGN